METALVTGANRGIGLELCHQLGELRSIGPGPADLFAVDRLRASGLEGLKLAGEVLILR